MLGKDLNIEHVGVLIKEKNYDKISVIILDETARKKVIDAIGNCAVRVIDTPRTQEDKEYEEYVKLYGDYDYDRFKDWQKRKIAYSKFSDDVKTRLAITLDELKGKLSARTYYVLKGESINTLEDICKRPLTDLLKIRNLSKKCIQELKDLISDYKLNFDIYNYA